MRFSLDRKSTRLNSSHLGISYAVFCLKKKKGCFVLRGGPSPVAPRVVGARAGGRASAVPHADTLRAAPPPQHKLLFFFFLNDRATPEIYPLSLPDALPI